MREGQLVDLVLSPGEAAAIADLAERAEGELGDVANGTAVDGAARLSADLPGRVRRAASGFGGCRRLGALRIRGHLVDEETLGATPAHWATEECRVAARRYAVLLALYGELLGDLFGWAVQQGGRIITDILPVRGREAEQLGIGSTTELTWHTEDAYHPFRPDYILLFGLRNPQLTATMLAHVDELDVEPADRTTLASERFVFQPDDAHQVENNPTAAISDDLLPLSRETIRPAAVLEGPPGRPFVRVDPPCMTATDEEAASALGRFAQAVEGALLDVVIEPGCLVILDNHLVVHGRRSFDAAYDGGDRWLKRACVLRDLRKAQRYCDPARPHVLY